MLVFDEEEYATEIINNKKYNTVKTQGRERCILVRYLTSVLNYSNEEIKNVLEKIPMSGGEYLTSKDKDVIFSKIINKANEFDFVTGIEIDIYKSEMDVILSLEDEYARNLLFVYLVYYKWATIYGNLLVYLSYESQIDIDCVIYCLTKVYIRLIILSLIIIFICHSPRIKEKLLYIYLIIIIF